MAMKVPAGSVGFNNTPPQQEGREAALKLIENALHDNTSPGAMKGTRNPPISCIISSNLANRGKPRDREEKQKGSTYVILLP